MNNRYSKLGFTFLLLTIMVVSSFLVFSDIKTDAKNEGYHKTLYTDSVESADASGDVVEVVDTFRVVDDSAPTKFYDIGVNGDQLSFKESGSNSVLTLSETRVIVEGSNGLCFNGTCVSDWPKMCGADEAVSWDSGAQEFGCMNISEKIDNEVTTLSAGDAINIDSNDNIDVKYGDGLTLNGDTLTIDSSACGSGEVLNYTSSGFTCVSAGGGAGAGQGLQKNGGDIDVGSGDGISTSADTTSVDWNDANDLDSNGDVVANRIISGDDTSVNEIWVDESSDELCYKASGGSCSGTTTKSCSSTSTTTYFDWRCSGPSNCDQACNGNTICDGDVYASCSGGTEAEATDGSEISRDENVGTTDCGGFEAPHQYDEVTCECSTTESYEEEQKSTTEQTLCVAGS